MAGSVRVSPTGHADERHRAFGASHVECLSGYPPVLAAATGLTKDNEVGITRSPTERLTSSDMWSPTPELPGPRVGMAAKTSRAIAIAPAGA